MARLKPRASAFMGVLKETPRTCWPVPEVAPSPLTALDFVTVLFPLASLYRVQFLLLLYCVYTSEWPQKFLERGQVLRNNPSPCGSPCKAHCKAHLLKLPPWVAVGGQLWSSSCTEWFSRVFDMLTVCQAPGTVCMSPQLSSILQMRPLRGKNGASS